MFALWALSATWECQHRVSPALDPPPWQSNELISFLSLICGRVFWYRRVFESFMQALEISYPSPCVVQFCLIAVTLVDLWSAISTCSRLGSPCWGPPAHWQRKVGSLISLGSTFYYHPAQAYRTPLAYYRPLNHLYPRISALSCVSQAVTWPERCVFEFSWLSQLRLCKRCDCEDRSDSVSCSSPGKRCQLAHRE